MVLILMAFGKRGNATNAAINFQCGAIDFGDMHGQQHAEAKVYRREVTYAGRLP
jgi:hypothetical protein